MTAVLSVAMIRGESKSYWKRQPGKYRCGSLLQSVYCSDLSCTTYITLTAKILRQMIDYGNKIMNYFYSVYLAQLNIVLLLCYCVG